MLHYIDNCQKLKHQAKKIPKKAEETKPKRHLKTNEDRLCGNLISS